MKHGYREYHMDSIQGQMGNRALGGLRSAFAKTFLPLNYPRSVRKEYAEYQMWDSIQALSSYLRGVLSSRFVFAGIGVGNADSTAMAAAMTWCLKDGIGIVSSLLFAYEYASYFEAYPATWRLVADTLCNIGLLLNMSVGLLPSAYFLYITTLSSICFGCLGIAAGASKSKISAHLALEGHLSDVTAKESTQETAITLIGLLLGVGVTKFVGEGDMLMSWTIFLACTLGHQYANYRLCRVLRFDTLNPQRVYLLAHTPNKANPPDPKQLAQMEQLFGIPIWLSLYGPLMGAPLSWLDETYAEDYYAAFLGKKYVIGLCGSRTMTQYGLGSHDTRQRVAVCLAADCEPPDEAEAYFAGCLYDALVNRGAKCHSSTLLFSSLKVPQQPNQPSAKASGGGDNGSGISSASPSSSSHVRWTRNNVFKPTAEMFGEAHSPLTSTGVGSLWRGQHWDLRHVSMGPDMGYRYRCTPQNNARGKKAD